MTMPMMTCATAGVVQRPALHGVVGAKLLLPLRQRRFHPRSQRTAGEGTASPPVTCTHVCICDLLRLHDHVQYFNTFCAAPESDSKTPSYDTTKEVPEYFV